MVMCFQESKLKSGKLGDVGGLNITDDMQKGTRRQELGFRQGQFLSFRARNCFSPGQTPKRNVAAQVLVVLVKGNDAKLKSSGLNLRA